VSPLHTGHYFIVQYAVLWYNCSRGAEFFPYGVPKHPYRIVVAPEAMKRITEEYTYEYYGTEEEI
jgi:hypothetical protein